MIDYKKKCIISGQNVTWCKLAYWEESRRVGALTPVSRSVINISGMPIMSLSSETPCNSSLKHRRSLTKSGHDLNAISSWKNDLNEEWLLRLPSIFTQNENPSHSVLKIREKLGKGKSLIFGYFFTCSTSIDLFRCDFRKVPRSRRGLVVQY